jgi:hypothetical protein
MKNRLSSGNADRVDEEEIVERNKVVVRVPATSATNLGPGFDAIGYVE